MLEKGTDASRFEGTRWLEVLELEEDATIVGPVSEGIEAEMDEATSLRIWRGQTTQREGCRSRDSRARPRSPCYRAGGCCGVWRWVVVVLTSNGGRSMILKEPEGVHGSETNTCSNMVTSQELWTIFPQMIK